MCKSDTEAAGLLIPRLVWTTSNDVWLIMNKERAPQAQLLCLGFFRVSLPLIDVV